jgi:hypothetical protein
MPLDKSPIDLDTISEDELLKTRLCDLPVVIEGTWLYDCIEQLYAELNAKGLVHFHPPCYLADEWLTPLGEACIGIPFYLAHPALIRLEKKFMIEAEGEGKDWCMKLLRHEAGHAFCYAYRLLKRKRWSSMFGAPSAEYKDHYKFRPYSRSFVRHLEGFYAQYHPEEDFVETFAVWLTPGLDWEAKYKGWAALKKLKYVDEIVREIKDRKPPSTSAQRFWRLSTIKRTLAFHYKQRRTNLAEEFPDFHDPFLKRVFSAEDVQAKGGAKAHELIKTLRRDMLKNVARYSGERKYIIDAILSKLQQRSMELKLYVSDSRERDIVSVCSYVTSLCMNYRYTGQYRGSKRVV